MRKQMQQGFTLIELMIVVAIIGILAAIAIPQYQDFTGRSQMGEALSLASGLKSAVVETANQVAMANVASGSNGIPAATTVTGKYISSVAVAAGKITATVKTTGVNAGISGATLALSPVENGGSVSWVCTSSAGDQYVPQACR